MSNSEISDGTTDDQLKAKVFISCGQASDEEDQIAQDIARKLKDMGYAHPYVAKFDNSPCGHKENIFAHLADAEYFLLVDFKREFVDFKRPFFPWIFSRSAKHRGSLFCQQELAVATYLETEMLAFQEEGVKPQDGLLRYVQVNPELFTDRLSLPNRVAEVIEKKWNPKWKNQLDLNREGVKPSVRVPNQEGRYRHMFHIRVHNRHYRKAALNCYAYLARVHDLSTGKDIRLETIEFKWKGVVWPEACIIPEKYRDLDAFAVWEDDCRNGSPCIRFELITNYDDMLPPLKGPGNYEMTYKVISQNFPLASATFHLHIGDNIDDVSFEMKQSTDTTNV